MMCRRIGIGASILVVCLVCVGAALGGAPKEHKSKHENAQTKNNAEAKNDEKVNGKGVITFRSGDTLTVKTPDGPVTLLLTSDTIVEQPVGIWRTKKMPQDVLIPGLRLSYEGIRREHDFTATEISFDSDDLALAEAIQAGLNPTAQQVAANSSNIKEVEESTAKRFKELGEYEAKGQAVVYFASGSYTLSAEEKQKLKAIAQEALTNKAYLLQVKGFADSAGDLAANQVLSRERAESVVSYLIQDCGVPVGRIVAPGAMSEKHPAASNETETGKAANRRVEVTILINKGIAGGGD